MQTAATAKIGAARWQHSQATRQSNSKNRMSMFKRSGSGRVSFMSAGTESSGTKELSTVEESFLHAAEVGDLHRLKNLLEENANLNVDTKDVLGRTALRLAVKSEHLEIVEYLLEHSHIVHIYESVLQAINSGHIQIAETILKHRRYLEFIRKRNKVGATDNFYGFESDDSQFSSDLTPLILASHKNLFEIVQILLLRGDSIPYPHKFNCSCRECGNKAKIDPLRVAISRLNAFRGLASEAYVSLSSKDPILTAFQLAAELRHLAHVEKYFMKEYNQLADQLSEYVVKLLDKVRCNEELEHILNRNHKQGDEPYRKLARFKLAIRYDEKKFISHPSCQQRLVNIWYSEVRKLERSGWGYRILVVMLFSLAYPFLALTYLTAPSSKIGHILTIPCLKFLSHALFYVVFLGLILVYAFEMKYDATLNHTLSNMYASEFNKYQELRESFNDELLGPDFSIRQVFPTITQFIMVGWILGFVMQECQYAYRMGFRAFRRSLYNVLDFSYLLGYIGTFTLIGINIFKVYRGLAYLRWVDPGTANIDEAKEHLYWMNGDRFYWEAWDPINIGEGLFSFANVIAFSRLSYILAANEALGPMHISLARMVKDVIRFLVVFTLVFSAFLMGLNNLYWYYSVRSDSEIIKHTEITRAEKNFGSLIDTFRTMFWSIFGRGEPEAVKLDSFDNHLTEDIGYFLYGVYNIACVTVLLNMLIATMARSYELIAEDADVEWKYARSVLYMEYIEPGAVLPVPLNLLKAPKALLYEFYKMCVKSCYKEEEEVDLPIIDPKSKAKVLNGQDNAAYSKDMEKKTPSKTSTPVKSAKKTGMGFTGPRANVTYEKVIQRIIKRYIFETQREEEVTEDDFEEVKQEISSFRYEVLNLIKTGEFTPPTADDVTTNEKMNDLIKNIQLLRSDFQQIVPAKQLKASHFPNMKRSPALIPAPEVSEKIPEDESAKSEHNENENITEGENKTNEQNGDVVNNAS